MREFDWLCNLTTVLLLPSHKVSIALLGRSSPVLEFLANLSTSAKIYYASISICSNYCHRFPTFVHLASSRALDASFVGIHPPVLMVSTTGNTKRVLFSHLC